MSTEKQPPGDDFDDVLRQLEELGEALLRGLSESVQSTPTPTRALTDPGRALCARHPDLMTDQDLARAFRLTWDRQPVKMAWTFENLDEVFHRLTNTAGCAPAEPAA